MGDPSTLRFIPASSSATPIDWTRVPEETKKYLIKHFGYDWERKEDRPLPATFGDLAKMFDETKFFGYLKSSLVTVLMDISEFGLQPTPGQRQPVGPRFYMKYLNEVWFLLFVPGQREGIVGYSDRIIRNFFPDDDDVADDENDDEDEEEKWAAEERGIAQAFDVKLEREVSQGNDKLVDITHKLGGWTASTLQSSLEEAQLAEAIMSLPGSHPAYKGFMKKVFHDLSSG